MKRTIMISSDSHVCEPPDLWLKPLGAKWGEKAPRVVKDPSGKKGTFQISSVLPPYRLMFASAAGAAQYDRKLMEAGFEDFNPGGWDPAARLKDTEADGVAAEVLYTTNGMQLFSLDDAELQRDCFAVYNDWLAEFCSYAPKKFAGVALISMYEPRAAVAELDRAKKIGLKGAMIWASAPPEMRMSSDAYDPLWAAAQELGMPISLHLAAGKGRESKQDESNLPERYVTLTIRFTEIANSLLSLIYSGVFERFPGLKLVSAEADVGWLPHLLSRADHYFRRFKKAYDTPLKLTPSETFRRNIYGTFITDPVGLALCRLTNLSDNVMWSTDYPHQASTWPHTRQRLDSDFAEIPPHDVRKIVIDNVRQLYGFESPDTSELG